MLLERTINRLALFAMKSKADIDADIRDELEFHLAMRTEENLRSGMSPADAVRDAHERFGDFEHNRRACRNIDLGLLCWIPYAQAAVSALLLGVIVCQAIAAVQLRASSEAQIEALNRAIERLQEVDAADPSIATSRDAPLPIGWSQSTLAQPWSDWSCLDLNVTESVTNLP